MKNTLLILSTLLLVVIQTTAYAKAKFNYAATEPEPVSVKLEVIDMGTLSSGRPSKINVWFPQGYCADLAEKQFCLAESAMTHRVVVFSHGAMGSANEYSWIGESVAAAGYVVIGVNHYGESWVYDSDTINPRATGFVWQRPQDISALLDQLATQLLFQKPVAWTNIIAIGHSAGGQTAAMLAGARFDLRLITTYCSSIEAKNDLSCNYAVQSAKANAEFLTAFNASQKDTRIKTLVMLDPALGPTALESSLQNIHIPALVIGASNNDFLPWRNHGERYAQALPNAHTTLLTGQEGHFVFLTPCNNDVQVMGVALCTDKPGVDRKATQAFLAKELIAFVNSTDTEASNQHSQAPYTAKQVITYPTLTNEKNTPNNIPFTEIVKHTPKWVFGLLIGLIALGLVQTKTRKVRIQTAFILPIAMFILSLNGMITYTGWQTTTLLSWVAGITLTTLLCINITNRNAIRFDAESHKLDINGSWIPLIIILGIFITRYWLGVATAMNFDITQRAYFYPTISFVLGAWSGFFMARGISYWRASKN